MALTGGFTHNDGSVGFSTKAHKSGDGTGRSVTPVLFFFLPPPHTAMATLQYFLVALFKSKKKTTCRFLKSRVWLRKPQVGM